LGHLLLGIDINDLPRHINHFTNVVLFADDFNYRKKIMKISTEILGSL